jgi:protein-tyrosine-phosphatase
VTDSGRSNRILFVCRGNLCRSPMAMALLRHRVSATGPSLDIEVASAGYYDWTPFPREAHPFARRAVEHLCGRDLLADHVARHWTPAMVESPTRIIVAEEWMRADFPADRVMTMRELAGQTGDVADPYGSEYPAYIECAVLIDNLITAGMQRLST